MIHLSEIFYFSIISRIMRHFQCYDRYLYLDSISIYPLARNVPEQLCWMKKIYDIQSTF